MVDQQSRIEAVGTASEPEIENSDIIKSTMDTEAISERAGALGARDRLMPRRERSIRSQKFAEQFEAIRITIASPEQIRSWSHGEIRKPETINYRTLKPERDGLFCSRIYGPMKDYECSCGKYKRMKYKGIVCEKCGVEVTVSKTRRERMGHIELAAPVSHIWFLKSIPSRLGLLLDMSLKNLEKVLYFERYVVVEPGLTNLADKQLLTEDEYIEAQNEFGSESFNAMIGAEALETMLAAIDLEQTIAELRSELEQTKSQIRRQRLVKKLKLLTGIHEVNIKPEWMILRVLPVIPPDLRPLVPLDGGRFATSDLNDFYRRVINRNNRLKRLIELRAPDIIVRNEKRMLQEAVDALFDNTRREKPIVGTGKRPLKSLTDMLKGKQGRFRQNLLGKRVDYSGRSVIVVGPSLKMHQCGLPKKMALELFMPFILAKLELYNIANSIKSARRMVEQEHTEVWDILEEVINQHPVLLNRAPTLHRLGIQAFEPTLIEGKAIQLHPLVCAAFNADFDGDQMAVHVPLSFEAQLEARVLMMSTNNILSPANGKPIISPSKDIVLGLYYISYENLHDVNRKVSIPSAEALQLAVSRKHVILKGEDDNIIVDLTPQEAEQKFKDINDGKLSAYLIPNFATINEIEYALSNNIVRIQSRIRSVFEKPRADGGVDLVKIITTPGRMLLAQILPKHPAIDVKLVNRLLTKKEIDQVIDTIYRHCGQKETVIFCDQLKNLGFSWSAKAGISFGKDDLLVPSEKVKLVEATQSRVKEFERQYLDGLITWQEKYNKVVDIWSSATDKIADIMMRGMSQPDSGKLNSVFMMSHSGARGSPTQIKQLAGMRGLIAKPSGEIIEQPIISNFKEGLNVLEYFNSTHGARKGLADTALKTANSGYLTRRLVDVAQDCVVTEHDCGTDKGIVLKLDEENPLAGSLAERVLGRVIQEDAVIPESNETFARRGDLIDETTADLFDQNQLLEIKVRSVLTCQAKVGTCAMCYGRDLARGTLVNLGESVGVIAAQSIGEPGTQLTMRTFHIGGAAQGAGQQSSTSASHAGKVSIRCSNYITDKQGQQVMLSQHAEIAIIDESENERQVAKIPYGARTTFTDGDSINQGEVIATWDPYTIPIISEQPGEVKFIDLESGVSFADQLDEETGIRNKIVIDWRNHARGSSLKPRLVVVDNNQDIVQLRNGMPARYYLSVGAIMSVEDGQSIQAGEILARIPRESSRTKDITGGLPRVAELFEARAQRNQVVISEIDGKVVFGGDNRRMQKIIIQPTDKDIEPKTYQLPKGVHVNVQEGEMVRKGDQLQLGNPSPHDILRIFGLEALANFLVNEIQDVYRLQGVKINDKHIETIVRQMLQKVEVLDPGGSLLVEGERIDRDEYEAINAKLEAENKPLVQARLILLGITKASLQTKSFISSSSFQETARVLTDAAINGRVDNLIGLKENVIVGRLIPAGTGMYVRQMQSLAEEKKAELRFKEANLIENQAAEPTDALLASETEPAATDAEITPKIGDDQADTDAIADAEV